MIIAEVEHFIQEGTKEEYVELMKQLCEEIQAFDASAKRLVNIAAPDENHLLLEFSSMQSFKDWHNSPEHAQIKQKLMTLISKKPRSTKFEVA